MFSFLGRKIQDGRPEYTNEAELHALKRMKRIFRLMNIFSFVFFAPFFTINFFSDAYNVFGVSVWTYAIFFLLGVGFIAFSELHIVRPINQDLLERIKNVIERKVIDKKTTSDTDAVITHYLLFDAFPKQVYVDKKIFDTIQVGDVVSIGYAKNSGIQVSLEKI